MNVIRTEVAIAVFIVIVIGARLVYLRISKTQSRRAVAKRLIIDALAATALAESRLVAFDQVERTATRGLAISQLRLVEVRRDLRHAPTNAMLLFDEKKYASLVARQETTLHNIAEWRRQTAAVSNNQPTAVLTV